MGSNNDGHAHSSGVPPCAAAAAAMPTIALTTPPTVTAGLGGSKEGEVGMNDKSWCGFKVEIHAQQSSNVTANSIAA